MKLDNLAPTSPDEAMHDLIKIFERGNVSRDAIDSILIAYNNSCVEMRSEARDAFIWLSIDRNCAS